jgi:hypothetical protein
MRMLTQAADARGRPRRAAAALACLAVALPISGCVAQPARPSAVSRPAPHVSTQVPGAERAQPRPAFTKQPPPYRPPASARPSRRLQGRGRLRLSRGPSPARQSPPASGSSPASGSPAATGPVELALARYLDNVGIASNSHPTQGNLDGTGSAFSAQALAAHGASAGRTLTYHGVPFRWPDAAAGAPDNVTASGQTLRLGGAGRALAFLVTAGWGPAQGTGKVVYASGSTQDFTISAPDWYRNCASAKGPGVVVYTPYRNQGNGRASFTACVYYASVRLRPGQRVTRIVLPDISTAVPVNEDPSLHIFAATIY